MSNTEKPKRSLHDQISDTNKSMFQRYAELVLGTSSIWYLIKFELITLLCAHFPGALGLLLRKIFYPRILKSVGRNVIFGQGIVIVHGAKISIGDNVVIGDRVVLDAKGNSNDGININSNTIISRNVVLACKNGNITIGQDCSVGISTLVHAVEGCDVAIGNDVLIGAFCYFVGGGSYSSDELDTPFKKQKPVSNGGVVIADNVWFGAYVQIFDGVKIGTGSIIGASTLVNKKVDEYSVVAGVPMKFIKSRKGDT